MCDSTTPNGTISRIYLCPISTANLCLFKRRLSFNQYGNAVNKITDAGYYQIKYEVEDMDGNAADPIYKDVTILPENVKYAGDSIDATYSKEPLLTYLQIDEMFNWQPTADDPYTGVATIPLQQRIVGEKVNPYASEKTRVTILDVFTPTDASGVPTFQGFDNYMVEYWQYIDIAVAWGGQIASFTIPHQQVTNIAHKNGVPILGNVFMAPTAYGGAITNTYKMLQQDENENFIIADKMLEMAKYYGFDGWFINLETDASNVQSDTAQKVRDFLIYMQQKAELEYPQLIIQMYDSMIDNGRISWQGTLNDRNRMFFQHNDQVVSQSMFIDFRWDGRYGGSATRIRDARNYALNIGRDPYDLYTGFDTQQYGYEKSSGGYAWQWSRYFNPGTLEPYTSIGFYRSDWTFNLDGRKGGNDYLNFVNTANMFWVGPTGDPRTSRVDLVNNPNGWYGVSSFVVERTTILGDAFHTYFNTGNGRQFFVNGEVVSNFSNGWNNISIQDILPQWRWIRDSLGSGEPLNIGFDFEDAYYGGSSLKISGLLNSDNATDFMVYKTYLDVYNDSTIDFVYNVNSLTPNVEILLTFETNEGWYEDIRYLSLNPTKANEWIKESISLGEFAGRKLTSIGYKVASADEVDYRLNCGEMFIHRPSHVKQEKGTINNLNFVSVGYQYGKYADARFTWDYIESDSVTLYEVFHKNSAGNLQYLGSTYGNAIYVKNIERYIKNDGTKISDYDTESTIILKAYDPYRNVIAEKELTFEWNDPVVGGNAIVIRLYEKAGLLTQAKIRIDLDLVNVNLVNIAEEHLKEIGTTREFELVFKPYEVHTIKIQL